MKEKVLVTQSRLTLCDPMDYSLVEFSRQEYWSGLPCPSPEDLPDPGIESESLPSPALADEFFSTGATQEAQLTHSLQFSHSVMSDSL